MSACAAGSASTAARPAPCGTPAWARAGRRPRSNGKARTDWIVPPGAGGLATVEESIRGVEAAAEAPVAGGDVESDSRVAALEVDLPAWLDLPRRLPRHLAGPSPRDDEQRAVPPAPGQGEAARAQAHLHLLPGRAVVLPLHPADHHRDLPDVLLPADGRSGAGARLQRHAGAVDLGVLRSTGAQHAPMGRAPDGLHGLPAHGPGLLPRRLQAAAGVQLGGRRGAAAAHPAAVVHRLPVALGPARDLGGRGRYLHDGLHTGGRRPGPLRAAGLCRDRSGNPDPVVRAARARAAIRGHHLPGGPLLAYPQGRRHLRSALSGAAGAKEGTLWQMRSSLTRKPTTA